MSRSSNTPFYVIGHRNPDTDAICAAIGHAALLTATGETNVIPARCGDVPQRTQWVLEQAGLEAPLLLRDVRPTAGAIARRDVIQVKETDTFLTAYDRMVKAGVRSVPVTDSERQVKGILRYLDLLQLLLPAQTEGLAVRTVSTSLAKVAATLQATLEGAKPSDLESEQDLVLLVGASSLSTVQERLGGAKTDNLISRFVVICGDRPSIQEAAIEAKVRALIVTGGFKVDEELCAMARRTGTVIILGSHDTASTATLIRCSRQISHVLQDGFISVRDSDPISILRKRLAAQPQELFPVVDDDTKALVGVISKSDLIDPPRPRLALVDHNEYAQAVRGVEEAEIVEVIDHHRLAGDLVSREPIRYLNEPVGSTSTLVARKFLHRDLEPERGVAVCLLAGLLSDTLNLSSPTTTELDREMRDWLAKIAAIEPAKFTEDFFAVGSLLAGASACDALSADRKEFHEEGYNISISQIEELGLQPFQKKRQSLEEEMAKLKLEEAYDFVFLVITDIGKHYSLILVHGEDEDVMDALPYDREDGTLFKAPGVVSRKKQIFPAIAEAIKRAGSREAEAQS